MRKWILTGALLTNVAFAGYTETRVLVVDSDGVTELFIDASAGSLDIVGDTDVDDIIVEALIRLDEPDEDEAKAFIEKRVELKLQRNGKRVELLSDVDDAYMSWGNNGAIDLSVQVPSGMKITIDDGSGGIKVRGVSGDLKIDDGSGPMEIINVGSLWIDDGSGTIRIRNASGNVKIDDGSGSIDVDGVGGDLIIDDAGSGSLSFRNVQGEVIQRDD